jgi:hypothetical protein
MQNTERWVMMGRYKLNRKNMETNIAVQFDETETHFEAVIASEKHPNITSMTEAFFGFKPDTLSKTPQETEEDYEGDSDRTAADYADSEPTNDEIYPD